MTNRTINKLNAYVADLEKMGYPAASSKITYYGMVYWASGREIYCHTVDAELSGVINGWKVADIDTDTWTIIPVE